MRVLTIEPSFSEIVTTDADEYPEYRRYSADNWEQLMGESWEAVYFGVEELERAYQEAKTSWSK